MKKFQVDDIDGCEFVKSENGAKILVSFHHSSGWEVNGNDVLTVYPDGSSGVISRKNAQHNFNSGYWTAYRI